MARRVGPIARGKAGTLLRNSGSKGPEGFPPWEHWGQSQSWLGAHIGLHLSLSAIDFVHWRLYNSYFAFSAYWNFPSTDARP